MIHNIYELANGMGISTETDGAREKDQHEILRRIDRAVYKGTDCGAWVQAGAGDTPPVVNRVRVGSIVEGADTECQTHTLEFPFSLEDFWNTVQAVEDEAEEIWNEWNEEDEDWEGAELDEMQENRRL